MAIKVPKICRITDLKLKAELRVDPQFTCDVCGSTARTPSTLCDPVPVPQDQGVPSGKGKTLTVYRRQERK